MPKNGGATRKALLDAACNAVAEESLTQFSIERIAERAGVSRRTFFSHFASKDELLAALVQHMRPAYVDRYRMWADSCGLGTRIEQRIECIFEGITEAADKPGWTGSCFIRLTAELGSLRGHPVHAIVAAATKDMERWFEDQLVREGYEDCVALSRQLVVLINGLLMVQLVVRSRGYGEDVRRLIRELLATKRVVGEHKTASVFSDDQPTAVGLS